MASQKLSFLQKIDPKEAMAAVAKKRGGAPAAASSAAPATAAAPGKPTSDQIFFAIAFHIESHPELVKSVDTIFQWKLTSPDSAWVVDLKNGKGSCKPGTVDKSDVSLELSDADFLTMAGDAEGAKLAMKLYMGGKLKIGGNVMASQKLTEVLKGIDREAAMKAYLAKSGGGAPAAAAPAATSAAAAPAAASSKEAKSTAFFKALGDRLAKNPSLAKEVGQVLLFKVKSPDKSYLVDLTGSGTVKEGAGDAAMTLTVADEDLATLTKGADAQRDLYQHGKLRVDGDARLAQKLSFLNQLA
jgi:3-hydroxyacyl-CoA dehydrogenase/3a,7a,12a-trihydroxy-5b-cholest-24-enoyl-CoA hydratase